MTEETLFEDVQNVVVKDVHPGPLQQLKQKTEYGLYILESPVDECFCGMATLSQSTTGGGTTHIETKEELMNRVNSKLESWAENSDTCSPKTTTIYIQPGIAEEVSDVKFSFVPTLGD